MVIKYSPDGTVRYSYDLRGLQTAAWFTGTGWGVGNSYDGFGRLVSTTSNMGGPSRTVSHLYDREGRRIELAFPDGGKFWTARDGLGRAIDDYQGEHGVKSTIMTAFAYDPAGRRSYFARRFGDMTSYGYDSAGRLDAQHDGGFGGGIGNTQSTFAYNPAGQLAGETRSNDSYAWTGSVAVNRDYSTNGQNQYTSAGPASFTYDSNGNLTSDGTTTFTYDAENRLVSASGAKNASLSYDPLGRLFQIHSPATGTTQFLHDGDELVAEYNASGTMLRRYIHGDGSDDPLYWYEGAGLDQPRFPHSNHQGSVTAVAGPGATSLWINTYDEYGIPGASNQGRFQYTGQAWLPELGMYYYKARIYSPTLGRFMQTDPIGYDDQINLYSYVGNDPINNSDPSGLETYDCTSKGTCPTKMLLGDMKPGDIIKTKDATIHIGRSSQSKSQVGIVVQLNIKFRDGSSAANSGPILIPPGPQNANVDANMRTARQHMFQFSWFRSQVKNKGPWDYKQKGRHYEQFGNFNYGATGRSAGISSGVLLAEAGRAQGVSGNRGSGGSPGIRLLPGTGTPPYGDDAVDQFWIRQGARYADE